jgi:hypothetical protein
MRKVLALSAAAALAVGMAGPSMAAVKKKPSLPKSKPLIVQDAQGDANGINDNFGLLPASPPEQSTPQGERTAADIVSYELGRLDDGKQVTALVGKLTLAAAPDQGTDYRIRMSAGDCDTYFLEYEFAPALGGNGEVRMACGGSTSATFVDVDTKVVGNTIIWTLPTKSIPGGLKLGTTRSVHGAQTSGETAVIPPGIDQVVNEATYKIGS